MGIATATFRLDGTDYGPFGGDDGVLGAAALTGLEIAGLADTIDSSFPVVTSLRNVTISSAAYGDGDIWAPTVTDGTAFPPWDSPDITGLGPAPISGDAANSLWTLEKTTNGGRVGVKADVGSAIPAGPYTEWYVEFEAKVNSITFPGGGVGLPPQFFIFGTSFTFERFLAATYTSITSGGTEYEGVSNRTVANDFGDIPAGYGSDPTLGFVSADPQFIHEDEWHTFGIHVTVAETPPPPPPPAVLWTVEHYTHEFLPVVVGEPEITTDGGEELINIVQPENLHFLLQEAQLGPHECEYEITRSALDTDGNPAIPAADTFTAYGTDFTLKRGDTVILAGMHTMDGGEAGGEHLKLAGKDWMHYLERRLWPYDADLSYVNWPDGFRFKVAAGDIGAIVQDILETIRDLSANWPLPPDDANPSYSLAFTTDVDTVGTNRNFEITGFDSRSIYDMIVELSQQSDDDGGFDFYFTPDKIFKLVAPRRGDPDSPIFSLEIDVDTALANALELGFTNTGPEATHVIGVGAGTSTRQGGVNRHFRSSSAVRRRLDKVADYGTVKDLDELISLTDSDIHLSAQKIHEIPVVVDPADIPDFWDITYPGAYIFVDYDFGWHRIDSTQRIVSMDCTVDLEGNERVSFGLNQYYAVTGARGTADW